MARIHIRTMRILLAIGFGVVALFGLRRTLGIGTSQLVATWTPDLIGLIVLCVIGWRLASERRERAIWMLLGLGMVCYCAGNAYWNHVLVADPSPPLPSVADALWFAYFPPTYAAVVLLARRSGRRLSIGLWFDGAIGAAALAAIGAEVVLEPVVQASSGLSDLAAMTYLSAPVGDVVLLALLAVPLFALGLRIPRDLLLLASGLAAFALTGSIYIVEAANGTYASGGLLDAGWLFGMVLTASAATVRTSAPRARERAPWAHPLIPALAGLVGVLLLVSQAYRDRNVVSLVPAVLTLVLVIARMALSLRETSALLAARARDAVTDGLTELPNRRALLTDLEAVAAASDAESPTALVLFDLDGFKSYNDTFGHPAGDALLTRIGATLRAAVESHGRAYRMGGDEFCAIVRPPDGISPERFGAELAAAMAQRGEGFDVTASYGCALAPLDGCEATTLLRHADDEMYARKGTRRAGIERQVQDALLAALRERDPDLEVDAGGVAGLAAALGRKLRLGATELRSLARAAALHDVGKIAIPDGILRKAGPLDEEEWRFVRTYPLIGQRIVAAAPALGYPAQLVRSVQERWDGTGYPDQLRGEEIPLAARIVAVCKAYQAMTRERPYQRALASEDAIAELRRCAGAQFDPQLVDALIEVIRHPELHEYREGVPLASS